MMASLRRVLSVDPTATNMSLKEKLWEQIQELHFSIWENSSDPEGEGYDMESYTTLESMVVQNFKTPPSSIKEGAAFAQTNVLPLPKITIPNSMGITSNGQHFLTCLHNW